MRKHWLMGALIGSCMLGLGARSSAVPMTDTLLGEVTVILDPALALDYVIGTPATIVAEWDTDDFLDAGPVGLPGFFAVSLSDNPDSSVAITVGAHTWIATDDIAFGTGDFAIGNFPRLLFDAEGDFPWPELSRQQQRWQCLRHVHRFGPVLPRRSGHVSLGPRSADG
jgi:hypothetical protein